MRVALWPFTLMVGLAGAFANDSNGAELTDSFSLVDGQSEQSGAVTMVATGGFRGYKKGSDAAGDDVYMFVREGASDSEYATITLERGAGRAAKFKMTAANRDAPAFILLSLTGNKLAKDDWIPREPFGPDQKWTVNGIGFYYLTFDGKGQHENRLTTLVRAVVGDDFISIDLESPPTMWDQAFDGLKVFVAALRFPGRPSQTAKGEPLDFSSVDSREKAEAQTGEGKLVKIFLFPLNLGGEEVDANAVYVPLEAADAKYKLDATITKMTEAGTVTKLVVEPAYKGKSFVPSRIELRASRPDKADDYQWTIDVW